MEPLVSVIVPAYNVEKFIKVAIESVFSQTYQNFEIIVVDDCSTDNTTNIVQSIHDARIRLMMNEKNHGPSYSRNRGIEVANGEWIALLDSDDWWHNERLEHMLSMAEIHHANIVCDDIFIVSERTQKARSTFLIESNSTISDVTSISPVEVARHDFGLLQPMIRTDFVRENRLFYREDIRCGEDFEWLLRAVMFGAMMILTPRPLYYYRERQNSITTESDKRNEMIATMLRTNDEMIRTYSEHREIVNAICARSKKLNDIREYYRVVQPLKDKHFITAMLELIKRPYACILILKNLRNVLERRMM